MHKFMMTSAMVLSLVIGLGCLAGCKSSPSFSGGSSVSASDSSSLVGTWEGGDGDAGASYAVTLQLNADGTYSKTLKTNIGVGGTHSGTWTAKGTVVYLSGDGNWPASSHDLSRFRKLS